MKGRKPGPCKHEKARALFPTDKLLDQKDTRILWNVYKSPDPRQGKLSEILIGYFPADKPEEWPTHLHEKFSYDYGNGNSEWPQATFYDVWNKLNSYGFANWEEVERVMRSFSKVKEFRDDIAEAQCFNCNMMKSFIKY